MTIKEIISYLESVAPPAYQESYDNAGLIIGDPETTITSALIALVEFHIIAGWVAVVIIAREFAVTGLRTIAAGEGTVIAASSWGKAKTMTQMLAIILALIYLCYDSLPLGMISLSAFKVAIDIAMGAAVIATIISGVDYFVKNKDVIQHDK